MSLSSIKSALGKAMVNFRRGKGQVELEQRFLNAAEQNNIAEFNRCMVAGVNPNCRDSDLCTALHLAAERGDIRMTLKLLTCPNILIDPKNFYGNTPMHLACQNQHVRMMSILLKNGANPNVPDRLNRTPLHLVVLSNNVRMVKLLVNNGAETNVIDSMDNTLLHVAAIQRCYLPMVKLLLLYGADPNLDTGNLPLLLECVLVCHSRRMKEIICYILDQGASIDATDKIAGRNALHFVALTGYSPLAAELLKRGCDPFKQDIYGKTPIDIANTHDNEEVVYVLECHMYPDEYDMFEPDDEDYYDEWEQP